MSDEAIKITYVKEHHERPTAVCKEGAVHDPLLFTMATDCIFGIGIPQRIRNILATEKHFPVLLYCPDLTELVVVEYLNFAFSHKNLLFFLD